MHETPTTTHGIVAAAARSAPESVAIGAPGRPPLTYAALLAHLDATGRALAARGVGRNDRVAIVLPNGPEMATAFLAVASFATAAPLNPAYRAPEFDFFLGDLDAKLLLLPSGSASPAREVARARGVPVVDLVFEPTQAAGTFAFEGDAPGPKATERAAPNDVALVLHTSGTTSRPKIVPLTHDNLCASAENIVRTLALSPADRALNVMPLYHIHGLIGVTLSSLRAGASVVCPPGFDAESFFALYEAERPTWYSAVPTIHQAILAAAGAHRRVLDAHRLRFARSSSAALAPKVWAELEQVLGAPVLEAYGMTEASHQMASNPLPPGQRKPGSVGVPTGIEIGILDPSGKLLPAGQRGEVAIRGRSVTEGYDKNPDANRSAFTDGWFRTGDEGFRDEEGYLILSGRLKEIINKAGEKISPRELDELLLEHPAVRQAVAFAVPHATLGEDIAAAVVLAPGASAEEAELREFVRARLAEFKVPQRILVVPEIPKGATGKLQRAALAERFADLLALAAYVAPRSPVEKALAGVWATELGRERVGVGDNYFVLGGDSLQAVLLVVRAKEAGVAFSPADLFAHPTIEELARAIEAREASPEALSKDAPVEEQDALRAAAAKAANLPLDALEAAYPALPFQSNIVAKYEPRFSVSATLTSWRVRGELDAERLGRAFQRVADRRSVLRTGFAKLGREVVQFVKRTADLALVEHDVRGAPDTAAAVRELIAEAHRTPFDLQKPPLARPVLIRTAETEHVLAVVWLHAVVDVWSIGKLEQELLLEYDALESGVRADPADVRPFHDYVAWAIESAPRTAPVEAFWRTELAGLTEGDLLAFFRGKDGRFRLPGPERGLVVKNLDDEDTARVAAYCRARAITPSTLFHGAWGLVQSRYLGVESVVFGAVVSGRWGEFAGIGSVVGPTMGVVPLPLRITDDRPFLPWLRDLQTRLAAMQQFLHTPWDTIAKLLTPPRKSFPAFSTLVVENLPANLWERPSKTLRFDDFEHGANMLPPLLVSVFPFPKHHLKLTFDTAFFTRTEVETLADDILRVVRALPARDVPLATLTALVLSRRDA